MSPIAPREKHHDTIQIVRIVEMNITENQPHTVGSHTILQIAMSAGLSLPEANTALNHAVERGLLVEENGRFRAA